MGGFQLFNSVRNLWLLLLNRDLRIVLKHQSPARKAWRELKLRGNTMDREQVIEIFREQLEDFVQKCGVYNDAGEVVVRRDLLMAYFRIGPAAGADPKTPKTGSR